MEPGIRNTSLGKCLCFLICKIWFSDDNTYIKFVVKVNVRVRVKDLTDFTIGQLWNFGEAPFQFNTNYKFVIDTN